MRLPRLFQRRSRVEPVSQEDLAKWFGGGESWSGIEVDRITSLGLSAVWACVRILSEGVASLPLILYKRTGKGKERATKHPLYNVFHLEPNTYESAFQWREQEQAHLLLQGNCYSQKVFGGDGYVKELWPLDPDKMTPRKDGGQLVYEYRPGGAARPVTLQRDEVLHVAGLGYDGIKGYAVLEMFANTIGGAIAGERYGAEFFKNDASPGGYIKLPNQLKDDAARKRLRDSWEDMHGKWGNKRRVGVLEQGAEFQSIAIPPEQAQFIETRKFGTSEIARIFGVPPHMIGDVERSTSWGTGIEQQGIGFVVHTLRPWLVRWEQALSLQVLPERDREEYFFEFLVDALLRGDMQARWTAYRTAREIGVLSANDVRALENLNPIKDGDDYFVPMNWMTVENAKKAAPPALPNPVAEGDKEEAPKEEPKAEEKSLREARVLRSATSRKQIADAHKATLRDAASRVIHREISELRPAARKMLRSRSMDEWKLWLEQYYRGEHADYLYRTMAPALEALAGSIRTAVSDELDAEVPDSPEIDKAIRGYIGAYVQRHGAFSVTVLENALRDLGNRDPLEVVEEVLDGWEEKRADRIAQTESVGASNSYARTFYRASGILSLIWMTVGSKTCPYCAQLSGRTVGIDQEFAMPGDALIDESGKLLEVQRKCKTPPLHVGCECQIVADRGGRSTRGAVSPITVNMPPPIVATSAPQAVNITMPEPVVNLHVSEKPPMTKRFNIIRDEHGDMTGVETIEERAEQESDDGS